MGGSVGGGSNGGGERRAATPEAESRAPRGEGNGDGGSGGNDADGMAVPVAAQRGGVSCCTLYQLYNSLICAYDLTHEIARLSGDRAHI